MLDILDEEEVLVDDAQNALINDAELAGWIWTGR